MILISSIPVDARAKRAVDNHDDRAEEGKGLWRFALSLRQKARYHQHHLARSLFQHHVAYQSFPLQNTLMYTLLYMPCCTPSRLPFLRPDSRIHAIVIVYSLVLRERRLAG